MSLVRAFSYFNTFLVYISYFKRIRVCTLLILNVSGVDIWLWVRIIRPPGPSKAKGDRILLKFRLELFDLPKSHFEESLFLIIARTFLCLYFDEPNSNLST